jgi:hypothetical protein
MSLPRRRLYRHNAETNSSSGNEACCNVRADHPTNVSFSNVCAWTSGRDTGFPSFSGHLA